MSTRKPGDSPDTTTRVTKTEVETSPASPAASSLATQPGYGKTVLAYNRVILYEVKGKKRRRKKKKYTRGLRDLQRIAHGVTDSSERLAKGLSRGIVRYRRAQNKSARRKKDGGITDFIDNWSKGASRGLRVASRAPYDFARRVNTKPYTRLIRSTVGLTLSPFFR